MFGHQDNDQQNDAARPQGDVSAALAGSVSDSDAVFTGSTGPTSDSTSAPALPPADTASFGAAPSGPAVNNSAFAAPLDDGSHDLPAGDDDTGTDGDNPASPPGLGGSDDLLELKTQALQQLTPIVGHLDQTPEEKFRTTMMMIQASDNQSLIKTAYEAATRISDEKTKAQALLDIVNEINYFTHQSGGEA